MLAHVRTFLVASLALAALFTFTSALGQEGSETCSEVIASSGRVYFLIKTHPDESGTCVPDAPVTLAPTPKADCPDTPVMGQNGETYFVPRFKRASRCFFTDAVSTVFYPTNVPTPHETAAAAGVRVDADGRVRAEAPAAAGSVEDPVADPEPGRGDPSRGAPAPVSAVPSAVTSSRAPAPTEAEDHEHVLGSSLIGQLVISDHALTYRAIARAEFVNECTDDGVFWLWALEIAERENGEAVGMTARARHIIQAVRRPADGETARRFDGIVEEFAALSAEVKDGQSALYAPLAGLWNRRALKDYGAESCDALYEFATLADSRALAMRAMTSAIAEASFLNVLIEDGREAADRHWRFLNRLGGGRLSPPQLPPDES